MYILLRFVRSKNPILNLLTDKEKKEILTPVLQNWIYGMMEATEGKVKAWDVVNESISGKDIDGDGYYEPWSATRGTVESADEAKNNFYWQDYLGDLDYVRTAVAAARKGFADAGGNPEELKLFINDYNLGKLLTTRTRQAQESDSLD